MAALPSKGVTSLVIGESIRVEKASYSKSADGVGVLEVRLLVVESATGSLVAPRSRLHEQISCLQVSTVDALSEIDIALFAPHIVLLELDRQCAASIELLARIHRLWPGVGLILVCGAEELGLRLSGYSQGADYCISKSQVDVELGAIVDTLLRRLSMQGASMGDCWVIDSQRQMLGLPDGRFLELSRNEYLVLECLKHAPDQTASRQLLAEGLGVNYLTYDERRLEALVSRLRRKITIFAGREAPIRALRNKGYLFTGKLLMCNRAHDSG